MRERERARIVRRSARPRRLAKQALAIAADGLRALILPVPGCFLLVSAPGDGRPIVIPYWVHTAAAPPEPETDAQKATKMYEAMALLDAQLSGSAAPTSDDYTAAIGHLLGPI
jgi:hypothetical protein